MLKLQKAYSWHTILLEKCIKITFLQRCAIEKMSPLKIAVPRCTNESCGTTEIFNHQMKLTTLSILARNDKSINSRIKMVQKNGNKYIYIFSL